MKINQKNTYDGNLQGLKAYCYRHANSKKWQTIDYVLPCMQWVNVTKGSGIASLVWCLGRVLRRLCMTEDMDFKQITGFY